MKEITPQLILGHGHFFQKTLLNVSRFVDYCKNRGLNISEQRLERFEELGIFLPMLRIKYPEIKIKRRTIKTDEGEVQAKEFGILVDGEDWDGEIRMDYSDFLPFDNEQVESWIEEQLIYVPTRETFQSWQSYKDDSSFFVESYYSVFQTLPLEKIIQALTFTSTIEYLAFRTEQQAIEHYQKNTHIFKKMVESLIDIEIPENGYAEICQIISVRYFPYAESDGLTISVPGSPFTDFDFFEYRRNWDAKTFLNDLEIDMEEISKAWEWITSKAEWINPISSWDDLVNIIKKDKRERLKDKPLLAETFKLMSKMLNLFYEDLTDRKLYAYGDSPQTIEIFRGKGMSKDNLRYMEFVANENGINPKPKLILMVEGDGEFNQIPRIAKWAFGKSLAAYRIQIINLKSVGEFNSRKIERFIDHFHDLQTIVYFILDNENNSLQTKNTLVKKSSQYVPNLTLTKDEFFTIWNRNIEFDNFTDKEIADAMTKLCESRYVFTESEIEASRIAFGSGRDPISKLYENSLNYGLDKPKLLELLFDQIEINYKIEINGTQVNRPILDAVKNITHLAIRNYQPSSLETWSENQNSGWLRNPKL